MRTWSLRTAPKRREAHYWGDCGPGLRAFDAWIGEANDCGRGLGAAMMRQGLALAFASPAVKAVAIDPIASKLRAIRFYERRGSRAVEKRIVGGDLRRVMRCCSPD